MTRRMLRLVGVGSRRSWKAKDVVREQKEKRARGAFGFPPHRSQLDPNSTCFLPRPPFPACLQAMQGTLAVPPSPAAQCCAGGLTPEPLGTRSSHPRPSTSASPQASSYRIPCSQHWKIRRACRVLGEPRRTRDSPAGWPSRGKRGAHVA